jgi:hypothetical protein
VTKDDIRRVVQKYLTPARRTRVEVKPAAAEKGGEKAAEKPAEKPADAKPAATKKGDAR